MYKIKSLSYDKIITLHFNNIHLKINEYCSCLSIIVTIKVISKHFYEYIYYNIMLHYLINYLHIITISIILIFHIISYNYLNIKNERFVNFFFFVIILNYFLFHIS